MTDVIDWLLTSGEPWTRYRTYLDLAERPADDPDVQAAKQAMVAHPRVQALVKQAATWPGGPLKRHNDAKHAIYAISSLADFGLRAGDPGVAPIVDAVLAHQSAEGPFQSLVNIPKTFGGSGEDAWAWLACDAPTLLAALVRMGLGADPQVQRALDHLIGAAQENGWRCLAAPELGRFRGPGKRSDPCPIANVYALKALAAAGTTEVPAAQVGIEMLLNHWVHRGEVKHYLFGIGTDFRKLKYPFIWYDLLHVLDVLSRFPRARGDPRFQEMVGELVIQADAEGRFTATSMYRAWKGWSFANKKAPSPWLTLLAVRIIQRAVG